MFLLMKKEVQAGFYWFFAN